MGMFDELVFHDMVDMGRLVPPIIPHLVYQTKNFDQRLRMLNVRGNEIDVSNVRGFQDRLLDCDDVLRATRLTFYASSDDDDRSVLETAVALSTNEEISKMLFFPELFSYSWVEYDVDLCRGKITRINRVYGGFNSDIEWTRKGY